MTIGTITRLVKDRGFGFITDDANQLYFFHYSAVDPKSKVKFEDLTEGLNVSFTSESGEKGPRAKPRSLIVNLNSNINSGNGNNTNDSK